MAVHHFTKPDAEMSLEDVVPGRVQFIRREYVEPVPVGTYIAKVFRVTGFDPDADGSAMIRAEQVDREGEPTGWEISHLGMYEDCDVILDGPGDLHEIASQAAPR